MATTGVKLLRALSSMAMEQFVSLPFAILYQVWTKDHMELSLIYCIFFTQL